MSLSLTCPQWCERSAHDHEAERRDYPHEPALHTCDTRADDGRWVVGVGATTHPDGRPFGSASIDVWASCGDLTPAEARQVAAALLNAADLIDPPPM